MQAFLRERWDGSYALLDRKLFDWQFRGYGPLSADIPSLCVAVDSDGPGLVGLLGLIPGVFERGTGPEPGSFIAMWFVADRYRSGTWGLQLFAEAERVGAPVASLGVNDTAKRFFTRSGYSPAALSHWVAPLSLEYTRLLQGSAAAEAAHAWCASLERKEIDECSEETFDATALGKAWQACASGVRGLWRNAAYYHWRYSESPGYRYVYLRCASGSVVARIEWVPSCDVSVLRLIEVLPALGRLGTNECTDSVASTVTSAMAWGRSQGCGAMDVQLSAGFIDQGLEAAGMRPRRTDLPESQIPARLTPLRRDSAPINALYRSLPHGSNDPWFFTKSDGDMDRPVEISDNRAR
jgi:hypothetical protein